MNIVLLESLAVGPKTLEVLVKPLTAAGHSFKAYERNDDIEAQIQAAKDADILMIANMPLRGAVIEACDHLKYIDVAFTGVDHVDLDAAKKKGVAVSNASGYSNESVAELAIEMMLSLLRNVPQVDKRAREGKTKDGLVGCELKGKTVGLVGTGAIGQRTAELCKAFGCEILAYNGFGGGKNKPAYIRYLPLKEMLEQSDIVSLHCPLTEASKGLINAETIDYMKPTAYLINAARGPVVDAQALANALNNGKIAGAGIDVFEIEPPLPTDHPLLNAKNTLVTPHIAFATKESMEIRAEIVFDNIKAWMDGKQKNVVI